ncbi:MAG: pyrimidine-nucleoside phosphorylase [Oscillospiraceae bacterium]
MRMYDIIEKKKMGESLTDDEIHFVIDGYVKGTIPDYQVSPLLMAIYFSGMDDRETAALTKAMMNSGDVVDISEFGDATVDKHSTGGVGDKTSLVVAPIMASLGCKMAKMSGRGLGHTGGTVDKLESIPGFKTSLSPDEFFDQVRNTGLAIIGSTANLAPADKKLYALRDVTATVDSVPLIASSIMSKKLAAGAHNIVLDVKIGSGAFMKTEEDGRTLARKMVDIGKSFGRNIAAVVTNMDRPLGFAVGNSLEVLEAVSVLKNESRGDLRDICVALASNLLSLCYGWSEEESEARANEAIESGAALEKFKEWITAQGGDASFVDDPSLLGKAEYAFEFKAERDGYISHMNAETIGKTASVLGAGREKKTDDIDHTAGIILKRKTGDYVKKGETIALFYTSKEESEKTAAEMFSSAVDFSGESPIEKPLVYGVIK